MFSEVKFDLVIFTSNRARNIRIRLSAVGANGALCHFLHYFIMKPPQCVVVRSTTICSIRFSLCIYRTLTGLDDTNTHSVTSHDVEIVSSERSSAPHLSVGSSKVTIEVKVE